MTILIVEETSTVFRLLSQAGLTVGNFHRLTVDSFINTKKVNLIRIIINRVTVKSRVRSNELFIIRLVIITNHVVVSVLVHGLDTTTVCQQERQKASRKMTVNYFFKIINNLDRVVSPATQVTRSIGVAVSITVYFAGQVGVAMAANPVLNYFGVTQITSTMLVSIRNHYTTHSILKNHEYFITRSCRNRLKTTETDASVRLYNDSTNQTNKPTTY